MIRCLLFILCCFVFIQWHDNYTLERIAAHDAAAAQAIVETVRVHGVECAEPIVLTAAE